MKQFNFQYLLGNPTPFQKAKLYETQASQGFDLVGYFIYF